MQSVNAIMPDNGMTAAKVRTAEPSKKITESFGSFMAGTQGDDSFKSTASVMDNIGRTSGVRQNRKAVRSDDAFTTSDTTRMFKMPDKAQLQIRIRHFPHRILPRFKRRLKVS